MQVHIALTPNIVSSGFYPAWESGASTAARKGGGAQSMPGAPGYFRNSPSSDPGAWRSAGSPGWPVPVSPGQESGPSSAGEVGLHRRFPRSLGSDGLPLLLPSQGFRAGPSSFTAAYTGAPTGGGGRAAGVDDLFIAFGTGSTFGTLPPAGTGPFAAAAGQQAATDALAAYFSTHNLSEINGLNDRSSLPPVSGSLGFRAIPEVATGLLVGVALLAFRWVKRPIVR